MRAQIVRPYIRQKFERQRRGLTQQNLADRAGLPQVVISGIEIGKITPTDEQLVAIGRALATSPARLLDPVVLPDEDVAS